MAKYRTRAWRALARSAILAGFVPLGATAATAQERAPAKASCAVTVNDLRIVGTAGVGESELRAALQTKERRRLFGRERGCFEPSVFEADLTRIPAFYAARGFPNARVLEHHVARDGSEVNLRVVVDEGEPVRAARIFFTGFEALHARTLDALRSAARVKAGDPIARAAVRETAQMAVAALGNAGYPHAAVDIRQKTVDQRLVELEFHAEPGEPGYFGAIEIAGARSIDDHVIRRELAYRPGERFKLSAVVESRQRLEALGLFESVEIVHLEAEKKTADVRTRVLVREQDLSRFWYSAGYGSEEQVSGELGWRHVNFLGDARVASVRGRWSWLDRGVEGTLLQRHVRSRDVTLDVRGFLWQVDEPAYGALSRGGDAGVIYRSDRRTTFEFRYIHRFDRTRLSDALPDDEDSRRLMAVLGFDPERRRQSGLLSQFQARASRDTTGGLVAPHGGSRISLLVERAGGWLQGSYDFYSAASDTRYYHSAGRTTLAGRVHYASIVPTGEESNLPFTKRYFLGGADTLRGWGRLEVGPLSSSGTAIGGQSLLVANGEIRIALAGGFGAVLFADAGNIWRRSWDLRPGDLRYDAGAGVRYASPFGLLRVDAGYQLTPIPALRASGEARRWRVHVALGHAF